MTQIDPAAYNVALAFVQFVEHTFQTTGRDSWLWSTTAGIRLHCVEHVIAALLNGDLAPLPGQTMVTYDLN